MESENVNSMFYSRTWETLRLATNLIKPIEEIGHFGSSPRPSLGYFPLCSVVSCLLTCKAEGKASEQVPGEGWSTRWCQRRGGNADAALKDGWKLRVLLAGWLWQRQWGQSSCALVCFVGLTEVLLMGFGQMVTPVTGWSVCHSSADRWESMSKHRWKSQTHFFGLFLS